jgi:hypothetical protein
MSQILYRVVVSNLGRPADKLVADLSEAIRRAVEAETRTLEHRELGDFILARLGITRGPPG